MYTTEINDLNDFPLNERNGTYGGKSELKEGITICDEYCIVKYPKDENIQSSLSEYLGSHIYEILGISAEDTVLGFRNNKIVVACKDFCKKEGSLRELYKIKNIYNDKKVKRSLTTVSPQDPIDFEQIQLMIKYNPVLNSIPEFTDRVKNIFIIDFLIGNNSRTYEDIGILYENNEYTLAPVYDNSKSFYNNLSDDEISEYLNNDQKFEEFILNDAEKIQDPKFFIAIKRNTANILDKMDDISKLIMGIPEQYNSITICTKERKEFYIKSIKLKLEKVLIPFCERNDYLRDFKNELEAKENELIKFENEIKHNIENIPLESFRKVITDTYDFLEKNEALTECESESYSFTFMKENMYYSDKDIKDFYETNDLKELYRYQEKIAALINDIIKMYDTKINGKIKSIKKNIPKKPYNLRYTDDYVFKMEIEFYDEKIIAENKYDLSYIYETTRKYFEEEQIHEIKTHCNTLVFVSYEINPYFAKMWVTANRLMACEWFNDSVKSFKWFNRENGDYYMEDILHEWRKAFK